MDFNRSPERSGSECVKVRFELRPDEDGYPPYTSEGLWAAPLGGSLFRLDNVPFFVYGVSCFDVISAEQDAQGVLWFRGLLEPGGHSTLRVVFHDTAADSRPLLDRARELRSTLRGLGCSIEFSDSPRLIAVDVPPEVPIMRIRMILGPGEEDDLWGYEEATLAHADPRPA